MDSRDNDTRKNEYDGVVYESTRKISIREDSPNQNGKRHTKNSMAAFYIITLVIAIILCMIIFAVVFQSIKTEPKVTPPPATYQTDSSENLISSKADIVNCSGLIQVIDPSGNWMEILDVSANTPYHLVIKDGTEFKDKTGGPLLIEEFNIGDIVDAHYNGKTGETKTLTKSSAAWFFRDRDDIKIDITAKSITIGNDKFSYNSNLITMDSSNKRFSLDLLAPIDILTVNGVGQLAWSVKLVKGHGSLYISNTDNIMNGTLEIDYNINQKLGETSPIFLSEGPHHLVIKGSNIETYVEDIIIEVNKSHYVKLEDIKLKTGWLNVQVNTQDYKLFIDNEEKTPGLPVNLTFGVHTVKVEKEGYIASEQTVNINELSASIKVDLHPLLRLGKIIASSTPDGAKVYVDSAYVGDTPISVSIEMGPHTLLVAKEGYISITFPINVDLDTEPYNTFNIELQPQQPESTVNPFQPPDQQTQNPFFPPEQQTQNPFYFPDQQTQNPVNPAEQHTANQVFRPDNRSIPFTGHNSRNRSRH